MLTCQGKKSPNLDDEFFVKIFDEVRPKMLENSTRIFANFRVRKFVKLTIFELETVGVSHVPTQSLTRRHD